jgi:hypothetical protein
MGRRRDLARWRPTTAPVRAPRADFLLVGLSPTLAEPLFIVIECDGAAFHSTREQVRRDAGRQAALVAH